MVAVAALGGFVRGFSGFGGAMVFIPLASSAYDPKLAVIWIIIADNLASFPLLLPAFRLWRWREILPLFLGAALGTSLGVLVLKTIDADLLRWLICGAILLTVGLLATGVRYTRRLPWTASVGVGGLSGFSGGATGLAGPPMTVPSLVIAGLITVPRLLEGLVLAQGFGLALLAGGASSPARVTTPSDTRRWRSAPAAPWRDCPSGAAPPSLLPSRYPRTSNPGTGGPGFGGGPPLGSDSSRP